ALLAPERDAYGDEYAGALDGVARSASAMGPDLWGGSVYHQWLAALRTLSPDAARDKGLPAPLATEAGSRRLLNTQLASRAELRHDNLLYAKQSFTAEAGCEYPHGYVDPYPAFYAELEAMARKGRAAFDAAIADRTKSKVVDAYFDHVADVATRLRAMAEK